MEGDKAKLGLNNNRNLKRLKKQQKEWLRQMRPLITCQLALRQYFAAIYLSIQLLPVRTNNITVPKDVKMVSHYISAFSPAFTNFLISSLEFFIL